VGGQGCDIEHQPEAPKPGATRRHSSVASSRS
jgi:hypothetical protein